MKVPGSKIVPCQGVLGLNYSLTFGLFTQVSGLGPVGPLVCNKLPKLFFLSRRARVKGECTIDPPVCPESRPHNLF